MSGRRLTEQQWSAIMIAMKYYQTVIDDLIMDNEGDTYWEDIRARHNSAMDWLRLVRPGREVTR